MPKLAADAVVEDQTTKEWGDGAATRNVAAAANKATAAARKKVTTTRQRTGSFEPIPTRAGSRS